MRLHVLYRSYGGENRKGRPPYYSKHVSLLSFLRSLENAPGLDVSFINNGPIPADRLELMQGTGARILQIDKPAMRPSYRFALNYAMKSDWADDDVVYLVEDDYLHLPEALAVLDKSIHALPEISYFLTYGSTWTHPLHSAEHLAVLKPRGWRPGVPTEVDGQTWRPAYAATSTYAVRVGALRQDYRIILQGHLPYRHHYLDLEMGLAWQGYEPYRWGNIAKEAVGLAEGGLREKVRAVGGAPFKVAFNLRAHRRTERRRLLYAAVPNLATHVEQDWTSPGRDWAALSEETKRWFDAKTAAGQSAPAAGHHANA